MTHNGLEQNHDPGRTGEATMSAQGSFAGLADLVPYATLDGLFAADISVR